MKKRLLSAFLALAMVLTLIPATMVTAFADVTVEASAANPNTVVKPNSTLTGDSDGGVAGAFAGFTANGTYSSVTVTYQSTDDNTTGKAKGYWYWTDTVTSKGDTIYRPVSGGIVSGTGTSGTWYPSLDAMTRTETTGTSLTTTSFTLLADANLSSVLVDSNPRAPTSLTIDVNGYELTLSTGSLPARFSSLTITNRLNPLGYEGKVLTVNKNTASRSNPAPAGVSYANLTVNISNTTVGSVELYGGTNSVTLNNVTVQGGITMDGKSTTTSASGATDAYGSQTLNVNNNGVSNLSTYTSFGNKIVISNAASATVNLNNATGGKDVTVNANGGTVNVDGASALGAVTVGTRGGDYAPPALTIKGGSVGAITRVDGDNKSTKGNSVTINSAGKAASLEMDNATVRVTQGEVTGDLTVKSGSLTLAGPVKTGDVTLTEKGGTTLTISGEGSQIGGITASNGGNLTISGWPTGRKNTFGALSLTGYNARGVKGGTFTDDTGLDTAANAAWFNTDLQFVLTKDSKYALYGKKELATAIGDVGSTAAGGGTAVLHILCQESTNTLELINAGLTWAKIGYDVATGMILPEMVNSYSISTWTSGDNTTSVPAGVDKVIPLPTAADGTFKLYANGVATTVVKSITAVAVSPTSPVENQNVRVTMNGTNIQISGAVTPAPGSNIATILLDLTTDALRTTVDDKTAGGGATSAAAGYITLQNVQVFYNVDTKKVEFSDLQKLDGGAIVNEKGELVLNNGTGTHYTVSASLAQSAPSLGIYLGGNEVQATVGGNLSSLSQSAKDQLIAQIVGTSTTSSENAEFDINGNRAILEAINAAQATITSDSTVNGWRTTAQNYVWRNGNSYTNPTTGQKLTVGKGEAKYGAGSDSYLNPHTGNMSNTGPFGSDADKIAELYSDAYIVPYLVVNATNRNETGTFNATLSVYYRVDVSGKSYNPNEYYTVKAGTPLSALTGDMATNPVKVKFADAFPYATAGTQMHQDGKYVYEMGATKANGETVTAYGGWLINHAGSGNGSLGTVVLNSTAGPIELTSTYKNRAPALVAGVTYDDLQAAIDDTVPGLVTSAGDTSTETMDTVTIGGGYAPTECTINMTGIARKVKVVSIGNRKFTKGNNSTEVQTLDGYNFIVQLVQDNVPAGTVAIGVNGNAAGTASVSLTSAKAGQTVTVTVQPVAGRTATGVTITTNTGATVTATPTGTANQYQFVVPTGATSVTVTPVFNAVALQATVAVNNPSTGSAITSAASTDNKVAPGSLVTVTTYPGADQRTMGLNIQTNGSGTTAVRTGVNSFQFTVPSNVTNVVVTPSFDANNNTVFSDVWSSEYYSKSVAWAVGRGITDGTSTYSFSPGNYTTRAQMMTFLWRAAGKPIVTNVSNPFVDVYPGMGSDYYNAILWAVSKGITEGTTRTTFSPSQAVTRAQAVTFLYRYENQPAASTYTGFVDAPSSEYYAKAVSWANSKGITKGKTSTTFAPNDGVTRAQAVTFLYRDITGDIA